MWLRSYISHISVYIRASVDDRLSTPNINIYGVVDKSYTPFQHAAKENQNKEHTNCLALSIVVLFQTLLDL